MASNPVIPNEDPSIEQDDGLLKRKHSASNLTKLPFKQPASKYDFVKVRVWIGDHYYTFSRFLVSRVLAVTKVGYADTLKISLAVKKALVDREMLDVTQAEMESVLFGVMRAQGYGEEFIARYRLMTEFNLQRVPLIILVSGSGLLGKSTLATQLGERLNLSAVLQTDLVFEVLQSAAAGSAPQPKALLRRFDSDAALLAEYRRECELVRGGLRGSAPCGVGPGEVAVTLQVATEGTRRLGLDVHAAEVRLRMAVPARRAAGAKLPAPPPT